LVPQTPFFSEATSLKQLKRRISFRFDDKHLSDHSSPGQSNIYKDLRDGSRVDMSLGIDFNFSNSTILKNVQVILHWEMIQIHNILESSASSNDDEGAPVISSVGYDIRLNTGDRVLGISLKGSL